MKIESDGENDSTVSRPDHRARRDSSFTHPSVKLDELTDDEQAERALVYIVGGR